MHHCSGFIVSGRKEIRVSRTTDYHAESVASGGQVITMQPGLIVILSVLIGLASGGATAPPQGGFIFIEERPPFTSEGRTAQAHVTYLNDRGLVQRYACEDNKIKALVESSLSVADCFKTLSAISFKALPTAPEPADENQLPAQAGPSHTRLIVRQASGAEYSWEGTTSLVPADLRKLLEEARSLAVLPTPAAAAARVFVRADVLSAQRREEYRAMRLLHEVQNPNELSPVLREALLRPFCLISVPSGVNPFAAFAVKGEPDQLQLLFNETGYELNRYSFVPSS